MAINSLQSESVTVEPLTLLQVGRELENLSADAEELGSLIYMASDNSDLQPYAKQGMRAMMTLAERLSQELRKLEDQVYAAGRAEKGLNIADFPRR